MANAALRAGDTLFVLPPSCAITADVAAASELGRAAAAYARVLPTALHRRAADDADEPGASDDDSDGSDDSDGDDVGSDSEGDDDSGGSDEVGADGAADDADGDVGDDAGTGGGDALLTRTLLYLYLIAARHGRVPSAVHVAYARSLPAAFSLPLLWPAAARAELDGTPAGLETSMMVRARSRSRPAASAPHVAVR